MALCCLQNASIGGIALKYCTNVTISGPANFSYVADQLPHMEAKVIGLYDHSKTNTSFVVQASDAQHSRGMAGGANLWVALLQADVQVSRDGGSSKISCASAGGCSVCVGVGPHAETVPPEPH